MKKLTTIVSFKEGNTVQGFYLCIKKNLRHTRSGDLYIDIELRDITGHAMAKIWDNVAELNKTDKSDIICNIQHQYDDPAIKKNIDVMGTISNIYSHHVFYLPANNSSCPYVMP